MTRRFIVDLLDGDETDKFVDKYGADEITNMTNGDVIKALFFGIEGNRFTKQWCGRNEAHFDKEWWNAPYKAESER